MSETRTLLICRHAEASWPKDCISDFARPLTKKGEQDAQNLTVQLVARAVRPDLILASSALRTRSTAAILSEGLGCAQECLRLRVEQYGASAVSLLQLVRSMDAVKMFVVRTLMLVGHNPESSALVNMLGDVQVRILPACAVVALEFSCASWQEIREGEGRLLFYEQPNRRN